MAAIWVMVALQIKHCLADFVWQSPWMIAGKGIYAHPGGLVHAGVHVAATMIILIVAGVEPGVATIVAAAEFAVHYHIDFVKAQIGQRLELTPQNSQFWSHLGYDQLAHQLTYVAIVSLMISGHALGAVTILP